jgi:hypothetical protein
VDRVLVMVELQLVDTKEQSQDLDIKERSDLKEVKCHFKDEFLSLDLRILIELSIK